MKVEIGGAALELIQGDITRQETDAIVNAANSGLRGGGGVDGAIHRAGGPQIMEESRALGGCPTGSACITGAGNLKAKFVIHAVGPVWHGGSGREEELLAGAYRRALQIAAQKGLTSISFPSISTGAYGYPVGRAARVALAAVIDYLRKKSSLKQVVFVLFDAGTLENYEQALAELTGS